MQGALKFVTKEQVSKDLSRKFAWKLIEQFQPQQLTDEKDGSGSSWG